MTSKVDEIVAATLPLLTRADADAAAWLHLVGPDGASLLLHGVSGFMNRDDVRGRVPLGEAPLAAAGGSTVLVLSPEDGHALFRSPVVATSVRCLACAAVGEGDEMRGLLGIAHRTRGELGPTERALLETAAALVGTALARASLADRLEQVTAHLVDVSLLAAVGQLVPGIAHEVNNPLTTVLGHTQLLLTRPDLSEHLRQRLELVAAEGARAVRPIQNLLAFARPRHAGRRSCALTDQARRVLELKAHQLYQDSIRVITELGDGPAVHANEHEIQHALLALVQRAHEAMRARPEERVLTVRTGAGDGQAWVDVLDTGPAIASEVLDRLDNPLGTVFLLGAGLALAHRIATDHGGQLRGRPRPEGGTIFSLVLPVEATPGR